jgi:hypothetical protein
MASGMVDPGTSTTLTLLGRFNASIIGSRSIRIDTRIRSHISLKSRQCHYSKNSSSLTEKQNLVIPFSLVAYPEAGSSPIFCILHFPNPICQASRVLKFTMLQRITRLKSNFLSFAVRILISLLRRTRMRQGSSYHKESPTLQRSGLIESQERIENFTIIISTFQDRFFTYCLPLVRQIRQVSSVPIFLVVNGNYDKIIDSAIYSDFLREVCIYREIYPICFSSLNGWASLLNTGIRHSDSENLLIINDDVIIDPEYILNDLKKILNFTVSDNLVTINGSWSHFLITRSCIREVGFFDERYLGIGEEDGDYFRRYSKYYEKFPKDIKLNSFISINDPSADSLLSKGIGKYSLFNTCLRELMYPNVLNGQIQQEVHLISKEIDDFDIYPNFKFRERFYRLLAVKNPEVILKELREYFKLYN